MEKITEKQQLEKTILLNDNGYTYSKKCLEMSVEEQRVRFYNHNISSFLGIEMSESPTHIYWVENEFIPRFNNKLFYTKKCISGLTLDKKTRSVKFWFGRTPHTVIIQSFLAKTNSSWYAELSNSFKNYFTISLARDIAKRKINSIEDYAEHLSKRSLMLKGVSAKSIYKLLVYHTLSHNEQFLHYSQFFKFLQVAKDKNVFIDMLIENEINSFYALELMAKQALALDTKIDFSKPIEKEKKRLNSAYQKAAEKYYLTTTLDLPF